MKKILLHLPLIALLTGCQSKGEICAAAIAGEDQGTAQAFVRKLGLTPTGNDSQDWGKGWDFCEQLKSY